MSYPPLYAIQSPIFITQQPPIGLEPTSHRIGNLLNYACAPVELPSDSEAVGGAAEFLRYLEAGSHNVFTDQAIFLIAIPRSGSPAAYM